jgi:hypothetical protein
VKRLCALLRSLACPRQYPAAANGWERTWQARRELYDLLDPPPTSKDPYVVKPRSEGEQL